MQTKNGTIIKLSQYNSVSVMQGRDIHFCLIVAGCFLKAYLCLQQISLHIRSTDHIAKFDKKSNQTAKRAKREVQNKLCESPVALAV